jgi:hypothetical protein
MVFYWKWSNYHHCQMRIIILTISLLLFAAIGVECAQGAQVHRKLHHANRRVYELITSPTTWQRARQAAETSSVDVEEMQQPYWPAYSNHVHGTLAIAETERQQNFYEEMIQDYLNNLDSNAVPKRLRVWLGGHDEDAEGHWKWINGNDFWKNQKALGKFSNWHKNEPNDYASVEHCLAIEVYDIDQTSRQGTSFKWNDAMCKTTDGVSVAGLYIVEYRDLISEEKFNPIQGGNI